MRLVTVEILGVKLEAPLLNHKVARKYDDGIARVKQSIAIQGQKQLKNSVMPWLIS